MYLSKKVLIDRFILQFYVDYFNFILAHIFIILLPKYLGFSQNNHYIESQDIYFVDMDYVDESDVVMFAVKLTLPCT